MAAQRLPWIAPAFALVACNPSPEGVPARSPSTVTLAPICAGAAPFEPAERRFPEIESSQFHTCALWRSGRVACWGQNNYRQIGDGTWETRALPATVRGVPDAVDLSVSDYGTCVARRSGAVACWGNPWGPEPTEVAGLSGAARVSVWAGTACAVKRDRTVVCAGSADGDGYSRTAVDPYELPGVRDAVDVAAGGSGICVLHACGRVSCGARYWTVEEGRRRLAALTPVGGLDDAREIVMGSYINASQYYRGCALRAGGRVSCFPQNSGVASVPEPLGNRTGFVGIGGGQGICAFDAAGRTWCFGPTLAVREKPEDREVADEVSLDRPVHVSHGGSFRCAGLASEKLACWGRELGGTTDELLLAMSPGKVTDAVQVSVGRVHTCVTHASGEIGCWGPVQLVTMAGDWGHSGWSYMSDQPISGLHFMAQVAAGDGFVCARTRAGEVFCFGKNDKGQLADGPQPEDRQLPTPIEGILDAVSVVAAPEYACALRAHGEVFCWGTHPLSDRVGTRKAAIPELAGAVELAAGDHQLCARLGSGRIACIGGDSDAEREKARDVAQVAAGAAHTCARFTSGKVACWGGRDKAYATADLGEPAVDIAAGGDETCAVLASGRVTCWGGPARGAPWLAVTDATRVATSGTRACALRKNGDLACWGSSADGTIGEGPTTVRYPPTEVPSAP